jgi:large subunit ribosomal protein L23
MQFSDMKLEPIISEKSLKLASEGRYTFRVDRNLNKYQIKKLVQDVFDVHVTKVRTIKEPGELKRTFRGRKRIIQPGKKAIVTLKDKEKIDLFEEKKKKKG